MSLTVMLIVLLAALLHASWNFMVKRTSDKQASMTAVVLGHVPSALIVFIFVPWPDPASWWWIISGALLHVGYQLFLVQSYKSGDLTHVYPIARGVAPLIVTLVSITFLGLSLSGYELAAIVVIVAGIFSLALSHHKSTKNNGQALFFALVTGCFIAGYSIVDGTGARLAGTALGFYGCLSVVNALIYAGAVSYSSPGTLAYVLKYERKLILFGGSASFIAFALVIWSFTQAPIALVAALRETSIVFALILGTLFLKESYNAAKITAILMTLFGVILLRIS